MQLYYFLVVLLSLCFGSLPESSHSFGTAFSFSAAVVAVWWCICFLSVRTVLRLVDQGEIPVRVGDYWFYRQSQCLKWFSIALILLCLGGFGLGRNLSGLVLVRDSLLLQSILLLAPAVLLMIGIWLAEYYFETQIGMVQLGWGNAASWAWAEFRCGVGWLLLPVFGCMTLLDFVVITRRVLSTAGTSVGWIVWLIAAVLIVVSVPRLVRKVFPTCPLDEATEQWIHSIIRPCRIGRCRVVGWETGGRVFNALIVGLFGRFRVLVVSDRLVNELPRKQLAMVILHEVAHAKRHHIPLRIAALVPAWLLAAGASWMIHHGPTLKHDIPGLETWSGILASLVGVVATVVILRWVSYAVEYDADATACRIAPRIAEHCCDVPASSAEAELCLAAALLQVTDDSESARLASWLHPAIGDRVDSISAARKRTLASEG